MNQTVTSSAFYARPANTQNASWLLGFLAATPLVIMLNALKTPAKN